MNSLETDSLQAQEVTEESVSSCQCSEHLTTHEQYIAMNTATSWLACGLSCKNGACVLGACVHEWGHSGAHLCQNGHHW